MHALQSIFAALVAVDMDTAPIPSTNGCTAPLLLAQTRDAETIRRLEKAWQTTTFARNAELEQCLLDRGFIEILSDGKIKKFEDELATTKGKKGPFLTRVPSTKTSIFVHGRAAVAYGRINTNLPSAESRAIPFVDYFVWDRGLWHVYFSRQSDRPPKPNW